MPDKSTTPVQGFDVSAILEQADEADLHVMGAHLYAIDDAGNYVVDPVDMQTQNRLHTANAASLRALVAEVERLRGEIEKIDEGCREHSDMLIADCRAALKRAEEAERLSATFAGEAARAEEEFHRARAAVAEVERLRARHDEEADDNATHLREAEGERDAAVVEAKRDALEANRMAGVWKRRCEKAERKRDEVRKECDMARKELDALDTCVICGADLLPIPNDTLPHCDDCNISEYKEKQLDDTEDGAG